MQSSLFKLGAKDFLKGLVMAVIGGVLLPIVVMIQTPGFTLANLQIAQLISIAETGAVVGLVSYLAKNFVSDSEGKIFGRIG